MGLVLVPAITCSGCKESILWGDPEQVQQVALLLLIMCAEEEGWSRKLFEFTCPGCQEREEADAVHPEAGEGQG